ncbi:MAG: alpha/beta fold hydrolase [Actinomycetota bacterium]
MTRRRKTIVTAGLAAGGIVGRTVLNARRRRHHASDGPFSALPPEDLGMVRSSDGTEIAMRAAGDPSKPVIVFVHGFSLDLTTWHDQWTGLSDRYRTVLFDFRSHGRSGAAAADDLSPAAFGHDVAAVLGTVETSGRILLVGHSMGSMAILSMAESHPGLFSAKIGGCVFVGSAAGDLVRGAMGSIRTMLTPGLGSLRRAASGVNRVRGHILSNATDPGYLIARATQFGPDASPEMVSHVVRLAARAPTKVWTSALAGLMDSDLRHAVRDVTVPSLVLVGEQDRVTPRASALAFADSLPDGRFEVLERAGHFPMMEVPDGFNGLVEGFAREVLKAGSRKRRTT